MNPKEEMRKLVAELNTLRELATRDETQTKRFGEILTRMKALEPLVNDELEADRLSKAGESLTKSAGRVGDREQDQDPDGKKAGGAADKNAASGPKIERLSRRVLRSDELKSFRDTRQPVQIKVGSFYFNQIDRDGEDPEYIRVKDQYAVITGAGLDTLITPERIPGINMARLVQPTVRDAFDNSPTTSNLVQFIREDVESSVNAAAGFDPNDLSGGNVKPESTIAFEEDDAPVRTIATTLPVTDQIVDDVPGFQALLEGRLNDFLVQEEDEQLLNGDGTNPNILGLLQTPGIQVLDDTYFADPGTPDMPDASYPNEDMNRLTHAITQIRQVGLAIPSYIMLSPAGLDYFLMATDANRNYLAGNPFSTDAIIRFRGLPIIVSNKLDDDQAVVGDGTTATVRDRMQARVDVGFVDKQFAKNQKTLRAEERLAFAVIRPAAHALVTLKLNV